jgi:hypothetical protein
LHFADELPEFKRRVSGLRAPKKGLATNPWVFGAASEDGHIMLFK